MNSRQREIVDNLYKTGMMKNDKSFNIHSRENESESSQEILIDRESNIIDPYYDDDYIEPNYVINEPQCFTFPNTPKKFWNTFTNPGNCISKYFKPITPQLTARSLYRNQKIISTRNHHININRNKTYHTHHLIDNYEVDEFNVDDSKLMSTWSAGFTIINMYLGLGLLSYPYALYKGGLYSFILLLLICIFMSWTGKLLVRCFIKMRPSKKTYPDVGYKSFGGYGSFAVSLGIICEYFGGLCMCLIFMWNNIKYFLDSTNLLSSDLYGIGNIAMYATAAVLPLCWILNLSEMSFISFLGSMCNIFTVIVIIVCFILNIDTIRDNVENHNIHYYPRDSGSICVTVGIYVLSFAGHPALPAIYSSMREPAKFEKVLNRSFLVLFCIYCMMGLGGYLLYADNTNVIITNNLIIGTGYDVIMAKVFNSLVVLGLYFQIPPVLALIAEIPEMNVFRIGKQRRDRVMQRIFRSILLVVCAFIAYEIINYLAVLEAITGSTATMITSVICPSLFYFAIYRNYTNANKRIVLVMTALFGLFCGIFLLFNDIKSLI